MEGDAAFADFVSACWPRLHRLAYLLTADEAAADRLLRDALEATYARWPRVAASDDPEANVRDEMVAGLVPADGRFSPRALLAGLGGAWPRSRVGPADGEPAGATDPDVADPSLLWPLLSALPVRARTVLVLRLHEGLGEEQTGELLGCPVTQVRAELDEARAALRRGLDAARAEDPDVVPTLGAPAGPTPTVLPGFPDRGPVPPVLPPGEVLER